jgi:hypothetical protein
VNTPPQQKAGEKQARGERRASKNEPVSSAVVNFVDMTLPSKVEY